MNNKSELEDALMLLSENIHKILKVNLTEDSYSEIKVYREEKSRSMGFSETFSDWITRFAQTGNVYPEDTANYLAFANNIALKKAFSESRDIIRCRYRRRIGSVFRWVSMDMHRSGEYTDENQIVILYIRDIHDEYSEEMKLRSELERRCRTDPLTGVANRYSYSERCRILDERRELTALGVVFADINGLKYINDNFGHVKGDEHIKGFAAEFAKEFRHDIFRISGDEFVALAADEGRTEFLEKVKKLRTALRRRGRVPPASIGCVWTNKPCSARELVKRAETAMYADKRAYYLKYPKYGR